jgi:GH15 family glucan-1,4-alpha-glucosidase
VIEAFNDFYDNDGFFSPLDHQVLNTIIAYSAAFCNEYPLNAIDNELGLPGILIGRYLQDGYCGGNPWVLLTAALAEHTYSTASAILEADSISPETYELLKKAYGVDDGLAGKDLADAVFGAADGVLLRLKHHVEVTDYHMREQISRYDGHQLSAKDLTWSYSNVIKAMYARKMYTQSAESKSQMTAVRSPSLTVPLVMFAASFAAAAIAFVVQSVARKPASSSSYSLLHDEAGVPA